MSLLRTKGTGNFKVKNNASLRCKYTSSVPEQAAVVNNVDIYMKDPSSTTGFVTLDPITDIMLSLIEIRMYAENDWQGDVIPWTASYLNLDNLDTISSNNQLTSVATFETGMQDGFTGVYKWLTTFLNTSYTKVTTLVPSSTAKSLKIYIPRVMYSPDIKVVYNMSDNTQITYEMGTLQTDPRFTGQSNRYPGMTRQSTSLIQWKPTTTIRLM